jgi:uncharacterized membrane protein YphA (DoxX/SURF4 family)
VRVDQRPNPIQYGLGRLGSVVWLVVLARCLVGGVFILSGCSKLLLPHAEVVVLIQQYQVLPLALVPVLAAVLPWLELISGTALLSGFFTTPAALVIALQLLGFCSLMLGVLVAGIAIEDCGCFGNLGWHETPLQVLIRDVIFLMLLGPVLWRQHDVWSVDAWGQVAESDAEATHEPHG